MADRFRVALHFYFCLFGGPHSVVAVEKVELIFYCVMMITHPSNQPTFHSSTDPFFLLVSFMALVHFEAYMNTFNYSIIRL